MVLVIRRQTLLEHLWTIWSCCLYAFYEYYYHIPSYFTSTIITFLHILRVLLSHSFIFFRFYFCYQCIYGFIPVW